MSAPAPPINVTATVDSNDQITLTWDYDPTWFAFDGDDGSQGGFNEGVWYSSGSVDHFEIEISRDGNGYVSPSGGPTTVNYDDSTSYSATYGPNSDESYGSQVGIDSMFKFHVRAVNADGSSSWSASSTVHTQAIPPHNPSVSRPSANEVSIDMETQSDIASGIVIEAREDTGSGYDGWDWFDTTNESSLPNTYQTGTTYSGGWELKEDARYQFRAYHHVSENRDMDSEKTILDYGNRNNVYFEDDFESGDISAWDSSYGGHTVGSGSQADVGISGPDQGSNYLKGYGASSTEGTWVQKNLGDLSGDTDVLVKCAFAVGSLDNGGENFTIEWYDGSSWQILEEFRYEYNEQGWFEVSSVVPDSWLSTDARVRFGDTTSNGMYGGDYFALDRVVVSDIVHEYTKPAAPSNPSTDVSSEGKLTLSWTNNSAFANDEAFTRIHGSGESFEKNFWDTPHTWTGLKDGEKYEWYPSEVLGQPRNGDIEGWYRANGPTVTATTPLPEPTNVNLTAASDKAVNVSWSDNANNENGQKVHYGTKFDDLDDWQVNAGKLVSDHVRQGSYSFYTDTTQPNEQASWKVFDGGSQPDSFTYYYRETGGSTGAGVRLVNSNGDYEGGTATDNDEYDVDFANTTGHQTDPGHGYKLWVRVHWDFDWANGEVTVTFEQPDGTNSFTNTYTLKEGVDIETVELWDYYDQWGGTPVEMWWDNLYFTEEVSANEEFHTITDLTQNYTYDVHVENYTEHTASKSGFGSGSTFLNEVRSTGTYSSAAATSSLREVGLVESVSSHSTASGSDNRRTIDVATETGSHSTTKGSGTLRVVDLLEGVSSHTQSTGSSSLGVINVNYGVGSHASPSDSESERTIAVGRAALSVSNPSDSTAARSAVNLQTRSPGDSYLTTSSSGSWRSVDLVATTNSHQAAAGSSSIRVVSLGVSVGSHSVSHSSSALRIVDLIGEVSSSKSPSHTSVSVLIDMLAEPESHADSSDSSSDRGPLSYAIRAADSNTKELDSDSIRVIDLLESVESHSERYRSSVYNDRTSLELLDRELTWNDSEAVWYSNWFQESKILGSEDSLAIRSKVIDNAKEPAATVVLQYDEDGNGEIDSESHPVRLGRNQSVEQFEGIPVDEDGYYRLKISEYSGYNSLYALDTAIIH